MSLTRSRQLVRQAPPRRLERPSLDRPSLFAGMEAGDSIVPEDDELPRGGILSTLESVRQRKPMPGRRSRSPSKTSVWQSRALMGLMGFGVLALLGSFIMVVLDGHASRQTADLTAAAEQAVLQSADAPSSPGAAPMLPGLEAVPPPAAGPLTTATSPEATPAPSSAAVIENAGTSPLAALGTGPAPASPAAAVNAAAQAVPPQTETPRHAPVSRAAPPAVAKAEPSTTPPKAKRSAKHPADADVALLEAMLSHTPSRAGAASPAIPVAEQLRKSCASLSGAAAATCRARICVNNPGAPACHDGE